MFDSVLVDPVPAADLDAAWESLIDSINTGDLAVDINTGDLAVDINTSDLAVDDGCGALPSWSDLPGPGSAAAVQAWIDELPALSDAELVQVAAAAHRLTSWALSAHLTATAELHARYSVPEPGTPGGPAAARAAAEMAPGEVALEISLACGISEYAAHSRLHLALALGQRLPGTRAALARGDVDWVKASAISDATAALCPQAVQAVEDAVLPGVSERTPTSLRRLLKRAVIAADPQAAQQRATAARRDRRVAFSPDEDGMGQIWARVTAEQLAAAQAAVKAAARAAKTPDDPRTSEQRQVDALIDLITGAGASNGQRGATAHAAAPEVIVTIPLSALLDSSEAAGELAGYGPIPAAMARDLAERGSWRCAAVDSQPGTDHATLLGLGRSLFTPDYRPGRALTRFVRARDSRCSVPGCQATAAGSDLDHRIPYPRGATCDCNLQVLCRHHHRLKHEGGLRVRVADGSRSPGDLIWTTRAGLDYYSRYE